MTTKKTRYLTAYLVKPGLTTEEALRDTNGAIEHLVDLGDGETGRLFVVARRPQPPRWVSFFKGSVEPPIDGSSSSVSAVLMLHVDKRTFALTFGYGRHLLEPGSWEDRFGLLTTLNSIDPSRMRSIDRQSFDAIARQIRTQISRPGQVADFGVDVEQDLLRAVTGEPEDEELGTRLTGRDALSVAVAAELTDLPGLLRRYLSQFHEDTYQERFPWVDHIAEVADPTQRELLDQALIDKLRLDDLENAWLAVPEPINWAQVGGFRYTRAGEVFDDLHFKDFLDTVRDPHQLTKDFLKRRHVLAVDAESEFPRHRWVTYNCIYCELSEQQDTFFLAGGKWYRVARDFVTEVNESVDELLSDRIQLPACTVRAEKDYNADVAASSNGKFAFMDEKLVRLKGAVDPVEFCDLYSTDKDIIHVKRYGGSSVLSHLFAQGLVSGTLFRAEEEFRKEVEEKLPKSHKLRDTRTPPGIGEFRVIFAIISRRGSEFRLPFFSKINARNAARQLRGLGYVVELVRVPRKA